MTTGSKVVLYAALAGNVAVACSKYIAAALSGSSAMLTEAVHSTADTVNQLMLLFGNRRSRTPPDEMHQFGYNGEIYFWTFVVAVLVLLAGGAASIWQGVTQLMHPRPIELLTLSLVVLGVSALFEGGSLIVGYRQSRRMVRRHPGDGRPVSLWKYIKLSKDPNLYETLLEDSAALIGLGIAAVGLLGSTLTGRLWMDGAASIGIGLLLIADSYLIADATRRLIAGEAVAPALRLDIENALRRQGLDLICSDVRTLHLGPDVVLVTFVLPANVPDLATAKDQLREVELCLRGVDERLRYFFHRFDRTDVPEV
jgi:cation diffusion facilitator family transporter